MRRAAPREMAGGGRPPGPPPPTRRGRKVVACCRASSWREGGVRQTAGLVVEWACRLKNRCVASALVESTSPVVPLSRHQRSDGFQARHLIPIATAQGRAPADHFGRQPSVRVLSGLRELADQWPAEILSSRAAVGGGAHDGRTCSATDS